MKTDTVNSGNSYSRIYFLSRKAVNDDNDYDEDDYDRKTPRRIIERICTFKEGRIVDR